VAEETEKLIGALRERLLGRPEVREAYLFGSHARGQAQPHSDIDVAVFAEPLPDAPFGYEADLCADLMEACGTNRIDLVVLNRAPPLLYHRVISEGVRIFARDLQAATVREGRALSRCCDCVPQLAKIDAACRARMDRGGFGR
jgi:predicted nucleotidyltransferase